MKKIFWLLIIIGFLGGVSFGLWLIYIVKTLPAPELLENRRVAESTKIYDRAGTVLLYEIHGEERRTIIPLAEIPELVKKSTIAVEDVNFYKHSAFDWKSIIRALIANLVRGGVVQGGSTITQQLVKNAFLTPERTLTRKIRELALSIQLERRYTKDQILELYLNQIPYGSNAYGIEAASQVFFEKPARELNLAEAALLAALPKAPSYYSPWGTNREALDARKNYILEKMLELGLVTETEKKQAAEAKLKFAQPLVSIKAPHFVMMVQDYLNKQYGEDFVRVSGLKVITTLDWELQRLGEKTVLAGAERNERLYKGKNAALVAEDAATGQILALVGSRDYFDIQNDGNFNVATQGLRQPGSAIKPFVYATAFKIGYTPETVIFDLETEFDTTHNPEKSYKPGNFDGRFRGPLTMRRALAQSINIPAVKTLYLVGLEEALKTAREFGLTTLTEKSRYGLSLTLGGGEVKLADLVHAYSVFAQEGMRHKQSFILEVSSKNKVLEKYADNARRVFPTEPIRIINDILSDAEARRPIFGSSLNLEVLPDHQIAVKTGTSNDYRDAWAIGYTPSLVVGVWAGNNDNQPMHKGESILAAAPIWRDFMSQVLKTRPPAVFTKPDLIFVEKPVLRGDYIVNFKAEGEILPQLHEILFYVDKANPLGPQPLRPGDDPQFLNWEKPVMEWALRNIPNFASFNQPLPAGSLALSGEIIQLRPKLTLEIVKPVNGDFIANSFELVARVSSGSPISKIEVYFNNVLLTRSEDIVSQELNYQKLLTPNNIELQNLVKVVAVDNAGGSVEKSLILFTPLEIRPPALRDGGSR